ncbi:MAG: Rdx family protein [Alphaproteobacteria bacterium]|nr:Rdx family protein [Alphaproteobacteria bacterium]MCW5741481.1 Rdx family protein [Alphaproteobacteria bacterium]
MLARSGHTDVTLIPGRSGQFDITVDGALAYTRGKTGRFPTDAEIDALAGT